MDCLSGHCDSQFSGLISGHMQGHSASGGDFRFYKSLMYFWLMNTGGQDGNL